MRLALESSAHKMSHTLLHRIVRFLSPRWVKNALTRVLVDLERFHPPQILDLPPGRRVLVLAPHPDDESIGCGGTLRKYIDSGAQVFVVVLTDGRLGNPMLRKLPVHDQSRAALEDALVARRKQEALAAFEVLGIRENVFLNTHDGQLDEEVAATSQRIAVLINDWKPDIVALPFLTDRHADHFATNRCFIEATKLLASPQSDALLCLGYEIWSPIYSNLLIDISTHMQHKRNAVHCYQSQLEFDAYLDGVEGLNRFRAVSGLTQGEFAEAFFLAPLPTYRQLYHELLL